MVNWHDKASGLSYIKSMYTPWLLALAISNHDKIINITILIYFTPDSSIAKLASMSMSQSCFLVPTKHLIRICVVSAWVLSFLPHLPTPHYLRISFTIYL